jgi:hypothetical protein
MLSVPDEGYSRNVSFVVNLICTLLFFLLCVYFKTNLFLHLDIVENTSKVKMCILNDS